MPLLIVIATGSLGSVIIFEATLGFLGLGIKYPLASWGSIINIASDPFVMTTYWFHLVTGRYAYFADRVGLQLCW